MSTLATSDYIVVSAASTAALEPLVDAKILLGYTVLGNVNYDGTNYIQSMLSGEAGSFTSTYAITTATIGAAGFGSFKIAGNYILNFQPGYHFTVVGSTGNDSVYSVKNGPGATYGAGTTTIPVNEAVVDGTADGTIWAYASY